MTGAASPSQLTPGGNINAQGARPVGYIYTTLYGKNAIMEINNTQSRANPDPILVPNGPRALAVDPQIIFMDEPFSALDPNTRQRMRAEIEQIWQRTGKTVVFVTHDIDEALQLADRIVLFSGKPTTVLETVTIDTPRPRRPDHAAIAAHRDHLVGLFRAMEPASVDAQAALS